jgi:hypothetical protein
MASLILCLRNLAGEISMKIEMKKQIPNLGVYLALYAVVFGVSIWLLVFHNESPTNWVLYIAMIVSVLAGLVKFAFHTRKRHQQSA